jgi:hypothetical protein
VRLPPPSQGDATPDTIARVLRDPEMIDSAQVPYLPPATPPVPQVTAPPVFDAKKLVEATKRKVENPVYGHMPKGTPEAKAAAEAARAKMRRKRRRNKILGWVMAIVFIAVVAGAGYALYTMYQEDQDKERAEQEARAAANAATADQPGALTPLGQQGQVIGALEDVNSGATPSAGALVGAAQDAQNAVDQVNGTGSPTLLLNDVLPPKIAALATELQPLDGLTRYMIVFDDAVRAEPLATPGWWARLQALPQAPESSPGLTLVPAVGPGEIAIALQTDGDQVTRLVVLSTDPAIRVDL